MKRIIIIAAIMACTVGCRTNSLVQRTFSDVNGTPVLSSELEYGGRSLFTKTQAARIQKTETGFEIESYSADGDEQMIEAVARGVAQGMKP